MKGEINLGGSSRGPVRARREPHGWVVSIHGEDRLVVPDALALPALSAYQPPSSPSSAAASRSALVVSALVHEGTSLRRTSK